MDLKTESPELDEYDGCEADGDAEYEPRTSSTMLKSVAVDFPFIITTTDKGNVMLVTDSQTPEYRHHWSLHSRSQHREGNECIELQRYACIKCKQQSRDVNSPVFTSCLSVTKLENGELILRTHPWTGIRGHICSGIPVDESDACILLRKKRQEIVKFISKPKLAFDELMAEVDARADWDETKKQRIRRLIGSKQRNERTFQRCLKKGQRVVAEIANEDQQRSFTHSVHSSENEMEDFAGESFGCSTTNSANNNNNRKRPFSSTLDDNSVLDNANQLIQNWLDHGLSGNDQQMVDVKETMYDNSHDGVNGGGCNGGECSGGGCVTIVERKEVDLSQMLSAALASAKREFVFSNYPQRRIALLFLYFGWEHDGLVAQPDTPNTVEEHIFNAMLKTKLISDRESCQWTRCGRTDKGVSGFKQVAAVTVRSNNVEADGVFWSIDSDPTQRITNRGTEHNYTRMLNGVLPKSIRVLAWCPAHRDFNARFNCTQRTYNYVFPRGTVSIKLINEACAKLVGAHDFRNFCHIDQNMNRLEMSYVREIFHAWVEPVHDDPRGNNGNGPYSLLRLTIQASGFLWHQIRCIVTLLYEIGSMREEPSLIEELFDIERCPARPQYGLANELPLCFFDCSYQCNLDWIFDATALKLTLDHLQKSWAALQVKAETLRSMIGGVCSITEQQGMDFMGSIDGLQKFTLDNYQKNYIPIMKRARCQSLQERIERNKKRL